MSNLLKNLLFALGLAVIIWLGYSLFIRNDAPLLGQSNDATSAEADVEIQNLLAALQELKSYKIDGALFTDPRFSNLNDFRVDLGIEPSGRSNPFAPIE